MKVLVLGGNVFLGKAVAQKFIDIGYEVYTLNRGNHKSPDGAVQIIADRNNYDEMKNALKDLRFDIIFDGSAYVPEQTRIAIDTIKGDIKHYIHISSASIYIDEHIYPFSESSKKGYNPIWGDYSGNKFECEKILFDEYEKTNYPITILRPFYLYGKNNNLDRESYVFKRILAEQPIIVPSNGLPLMHFGYIDDLCDAVEVICSSDVSCGKAYNIAGKEYVSFTGWIETCAAALRKKAEILYVDTKSFGIKARDWFPFREVNMIGDCSLIENELGIRPKYSFEEGIREIVKNIDKEALVNSLEINDTEKILLSKIKQGNADK